MDKAATASLDMSVERLDPQQPDVFGLTERERLYERISHPRFMALLTDAQSVIHHIDVASNDYGEFLFITISRPAGERRIFRTFWGLGYHEYRERWITDEWRWYDTQQMLHTMPQQIAPADAQAFIQARLDDIRPHLTAKAQSTRGKLFELLADLTDEDGALAELDDLGWWLLDTPDE